MKKLILLLFIPLVFACSDDNSNNTISIDGRWNIVSNTVDEVQTELNSCTIQTHMILDDGQGNVYVYGNPDDIQGQCNEIQVRELTYSLTDIPNIFIFSFSNNPNAGDITAHLEGNNLLWSQSSNEGNETFVWVKD